MTSYVEVTEIRIAMEQADAFKENPTVRPGMENRSAENIARQQQERVDHLLGEAEEFDAQAEAADSLADGLERLLKESD